MEAERRRGKGEERKDKKRKRKRKEERKKKEDEKKWEEEREKKIEEEEDHEEEQEESVREEGTFWPIVEIEFERVAKKAQEKTEKAKSGLLKIKVMAQGVKILAEEKLEISLHARNNVEQPTFSKWVSFKTK